VETTIEALGCPAQNERGEDPPDGAADDHGQKRREVGEDPREYCADEGAHERHRGSDRDQPDFRSVTGFQAIV